MASGGARNRSGPQPSEGSARSDSRNYSLTALPAEGYTGKVPPFPLPAAIDRELDVWRWAWSTPQACAWSLPSEHWRIRKVADWVRLSVRCEDASASAGLIAQLHRLDDKVGFSTAGLAEMGWKVAVDEVGQRRVEEDEPERPRRLRAVAHE